jgi:hypothetical protein
MRRIDHFSFGIRRQSTIEFEAEPELAPGEFDVLRIDVELVLVTTFLIRYFR